MPLSVHCRTWAPEALLALVTPGSRPLLMLARRSERARFSRVRAALLLVSGLFGNGRACGFSLQPALLITRNARRGRGQTGGTGPRDPPCGRGDVHDVGDLAQVVSGGGQQMRQGRVGHVEQAVLADRDHLLPLLHVGARDRAEQHQAGVVDQDVEPAEPVEDRLHRLPGLGAVGDAGLDGQPGAASGVDRGYQRVEAVLAPGDGSDGGVQLGEPAGGGFADAATSRSFS